MVTEAFPEEGLLELARKRPTLSQFSLPGPAPEIRTHVSWLSPEQKNLSSYRSVGQLAQVHLILTGLIQTALLQIKDWLGNYGDWIWVCSVWWLLLGPMLKLQQLPKACFYFKSSPEDMFLLLFRERNIIVRN